MTSLVSEYLTIAESLKTQIEFSATENNSVTPVSIIPSRNTAGRAELQAKFPNSLITSSLDINMLELRVKISSIDEYAYPQSVIDGIDSPVEISRELLRSWWTSERKQLDVLHQISSTSPVRTRGGLVLLNKGVAESYYLEDFLSIMTTQGSYPLAKDEDIFLRLTDAGYGLMSGADTVLFTGVFTHYLSIIE